MQKHFARLFFITLLFLYYTAATADEGKMPITTSLPLALKEYLKGRDLAERLRGQDARIHFARALEADSISALAYLNHAFVQLNARAFFEEFAKARAQVEQISAGERLWILGVEAGFSGFSAKQRTLYQQLVEEYPQDERAHNILATHYFGQQQYAEPIAEYEKALELNANFSSHYNQLGYAHRFSGEYEEARKIFAQYIELIPDDPNPYDSHAELLLKMGEYDASIDSYRKALSLDLHFVASHMGIAINQVYKGQYAAAHAQLE
jgi:tetratricopeptide (TPR) repeat protein